MPPTRSSKSSQSQQPSNNNNTLDDSQQNVENAELSCTLTDDSTPLSQLTLGDLKQILKSSVDESLQPIKNEIKSINDRLNDIEAYKHVIDNVKAQVTHLVESTLPDTVSHFNEMVEALAMQNINLNTHRRKFSVIIYGLPGEKEEDSDITRKSVITMAKENLKIKPTPERPVREDQLAACHRLKPDAGSGIIARFNDLRERDRWLAHAKNLAGSDISISVDVPPCLRPAKKQLMNIRKALPPGVKKRAYIKHLPSWPYLQLHRHDESTPTPHTFTKTQIVNLALGLDSKTSSNLELSKPNG